MGPLQAAIAEACLGERTGEPLAEDLRGFLRERGVPLEDADAVVSTPAGLSIYRSLVRNGLSAVVLRILPRTRARLNRVCGGRFDADFAAFLDERGPRTHYLRDVPAELFAWAGPRWRGDPAVPRYVVDLAAHELTHFAVAAAESTRGAVDIGDVALDEPLSFVDSARMARYAWTVHELSPEVDATDSPIERDVRLLAYRDASHAVRWLELTPLAAAIVARLLGGATLRAGVNDACAEFSTPTSPAVADVARLLADLGTRGVLLGGAPSSP